MPEIAKKTVNLLSTTTHLMDKTQLLATLNQPQQQAVLATEGHVRVVAGAGSGKTRVIAHRYAYIVSCLGIDPANVLCLTFTNKAAQEMRSRIGKLVPQGSVSDLVCTIHGFCVKLLRRDIYRMGFPKEFIILDDDDKKSMAKQAFDELGIARKDSTVKQFLERLGAFKYANRERYIEQYMLPNSQAVTDVATEVELRYMQLQVKYYALDFDDLMYFSLYLLNHYKPVREFWHEELNYIQVDEAQDCDNDDWELIRTLAAGHGNLCVVGDPDQCIYEWRGAKPEMFINFEATTDVILNQNYRSTPNILKAANAVISNNHNRIPKELFTQNKPGLVPVHYHARTTDDEARHIAHYISRKLKQGERADHFAILYRATHLSRSVEQALLQERISYAVWGGIRFFERKEIKDALAYLRLVAYADDLSLLRVINYPSRKFGRKSIERLQNDARCNGRSLYAELHHQCSEGMQRPAMQRFVNLIDHCSSVKADMAISDLLEEILSTSGLKDELRNDPDEERLENVLELLNSIKHYEQTHEHDEVTLESYLQDIALYTNADNHRNEATVKLMTIHQAKGLEFNNVIICGLTEGLFPSHRTIRERKEEGEEEERRLMYVAITRARKELLMTESEGYNMVTKTERYPSRYLTEIPEELLLRKGDLDPSLLEYSKLYSSIEEPRKTEPAEDFAPGNLVEHEVFGLGIVLEFLSDRRSYRVRFGDTTRTIKIEFLAVHKQD